jgi:AsmA protein
VRVLKWVSIGLGGLLALVIIGVLVVVWLVDPNRFKSRIETAVREATGREFTLVGDIELGFFPWLALRTGEGRFGNAPGFGPEPMVSWRSAQLGAKLLPLLRGELVANRVQLTGVDLRLLRRVDGHGNWEGIGNRQTGKGTEPEGEMTLRVDGVQIEDARISFVDETVPRRIEVAGFDFTTDEIARGEPFTDTELSGTLHMDGFAPTGVPFAFKVPRAELNESLSSLAVEEFELSFGVLEVEGGVKGTLGEKPSLSGRVSTNQFDPRSLLAAVGIEPPKTTDPGAFASVQAATNWSFDAGAIKADALALTLDDTHLAGSFQRGAGEQAIGEFALTGDSLDVTRYVPPSDPASEPFVLPTAMLKALRFRGKLELEQATYADIVMKGVTLRLLLDDQGLRGEAPK